MKALAVNKIWLLAGLLVVCGAAATFLFIAKTSRKAPSPHEIAFWIDVQGEVQVRKPNTDEFVAATIDGSILSTETARTGLNGRAEFEVLGGVGFEIFEESRVLFERRPNNKVRLTLLEGRLRWKGTGDLVYAEVARQGNIVPVAELKDSEISANTQTISSGSFANLVVPTEAADVGSSDRVEPEYSALDAADRKTISQDEILTALQGRVGQFRRCYLSLIQRSKNEKIRANILLSFMIKSNGDVEDSRVWKSNVDDRLFLGCLSEVVARIRFKPFHGDPVRVDEFPLDFE